MLVRLDSEFVVGVYLLGTRIRQFFDLQVFVLKRANFCLRVSQKLFVEVKGVVGNTLQLSLYDLEGSKLYRTYSNSIMEADVEVKEINVSDLPTGIYTLQIVQNETIETKSIVVYK